MKTQALAAFAGALTLLAGGSAQAGLNCLAPVQDYVGREFEAARRGGGVQALDVFHQGHPINLGSRLEVKSVEVLDRNKQSYDVDIHLSRINGELSRSTLSARVSGVDNETCEFERDKPLVFQFFDFPNQGPHIPRHI